LPLRRPAAAASSSGSVSMRSLRAARASSAPSPSARRTTVWPYSAPSPMSESTLEASSASSAGSPSPAIVISKSYSPAASASSAAGRACSPTVLPTFAVISAICLSFLFAPTLFRRSLLLLGRCLSMIVCSSSALTRRCRRPAFSGSFLPPSSGSQPELVEHRQPAPDRSLGLLSRSRTQSELGALLRLVQRDGAQHLGHCRQRAGSHGQAGHTEADEHDGQGGIRRGLPADSDGLLRRQSLRGGHADEFQDRRLPGVAEFGETAEHPIRGHDVLGQIIGADGGELDLAEDRFGPQRRRRDLDHDP